MTNAATMSLLSTVISQTALFSSCIDETTLEQIMPIVRGHNVLDAKVAPQWLQFMRNRRYSIILIRIGDAKIVRGRRGATEARGFRPIAVVHPPGVARKSRLI